MRRINSRHNPVVARYRAAARGTDAALLLDGVHLIQEALEARCGIRHAAVASDALARSDVAQLVDAIARAGAEVVAATGSVMDALSPLRSSSVLVALADRPKPKLAALYRNAALVLIAVDVQDPGNVGAIVRVAEAAGATGMIAAGACADPFGWKALRGSMGSALRLPIAVDRDAAHAIESARAHGCRIIATGPRGGRAFFGVRFTEATAILIGGEGPGLAPAVVAEADERITVPMAAPVESLNAAVTAALILYEARRQRMEMR